MTYHFNTYWKASFYIAGCTYYRHVFCLLLSCLLATFTVHAQTDIILQDIIVGNVVVSAPGSVTLKPGFHAVAGCSFHAYIGPLQPQDTSVIINPPNGSSIPVEGSSDNNFITTITFREPRQSVPTDGFKHIEEIQYYDGLGRPSQKILVGASPEENDIIQPSFYDSFGREAIKSLPYTEEKTGLFRTGVTETIVDDYYNSQTPSGIEPDSRAYESTGFDNSPLNRIVSKTGPGVAWEAKPVMTNYLTNTSAIQGWRVSSDYSYNSLSYATNMLFVIETIDEEGNTNREYKDKLSRVVLKESRLGTNWLRTAYIYDDFGLLRCVVPPEAAGPEDNSLCYYYLYDERNRMVEKKIPGGGTIKMVYDARDRLRFTQNSQQASDNKWAFTKYDELNRPVITGMLNNYSYGVEALKTAMNASPLNDTRDNNNATGYNNTSFPTSNTDVLTVTYYDNYDFFNITGDPICDSLMSDEYDDGDYDIHNLLASSNRDRITCTMTKVLSDPNDVSIVRKSMLFTTYYYDKFGNVLRTISENHLSGKDIVTNLYEDITFLLAQSKQEHYKGTESVIIEKWFEYDHTGRLLATREKINDQEPVTLNAMKYNEVGELITKYLHSNQNTGERTFVQKADYQYNIRGWLTGINDPSLENENDLFGMQLFYNNTSGLGNITPPSGLYNGNIVGIKWGIKNDTVRGYQFTYDGLNRLLQADYAQGSLLDLNHGYFSEIITGYDKNGNIQGLQRKYNNILVDNLDYDYLNSGRSNQLLKITDTGTLNSDIDDYPGTSQDYSYDANGNMTFDGAKNLIIDYYKNLNLPQKIDFGGNNRIYYHYSAAGAKLVKHKIPATGSGSIAHYIGNIVYEDGSLSYILTDEGRLVAIGEGTDREFLYEYSLKDHLGNSRITFMGTDLGGAVDIVQTTNYYPFGLVMSQNNESYSPDYRKNMYLYNSKELQDDKMTSEALNWYDYGARFYDPQIGRFTCLDPIADKFNWVSPYNYAENDPVGSIDLWGLQKLPFQVHMAMFPNNPFGGLLSYGRDYITSHGLWKMTEGFQMKAANYSQFHTENSLTENVPKDVLSKWERQGDQRANNMILEGGGEWFGQCHTLMGLAFGGVESTLETGLMRQSIWSLNQVDRGLEAERILGGNLPANFPVIDKIENGVATSIKSVDLGAKTYNQGNGLLNTFKGYVNTLNNFTEGSLSGVTARQGIEFTSKSLEVGIQPGKATLQQWEQIGKAMEYAKNQNIQFNLRFLK
jgi:RHS repeat-associated protein